MNFFKKYAVSIAFIRAVIVTVAIGFILFSHDDKHENVLYAIIFICLLTIPIFELLKRKNKSDS
ncbi:hypothetical protein D7X33_21655 [Butyricicoccus sp. 1XD8-22]|nr:hypothetical protein D7X33_21655 [Butyricicoccus sp. 1XD8-22]